MDAWNSPNHGVVLPLQFVKDAIQVLLISNPLVFFDHGNRQQRWDLCKTLARNINTKRPAFTFGQDLLDYVCLEMPLKFLDSRIGWQRAVEDFLFRAHTGLIEEEGGEVHPGHSNLRAQLMGIWNSLKHLPMMESGNKIIQDAVWFLYSNNKFSPLTVDLNASSKEQHKELCRELTEASRSSSGIHFIEVERNGARPEQFMNAICGDIVEYEDDE